MTCDCVEVKIEVLNGDGNTMSTAGCTRFEVEVLGNTPIMFDGMAAIYPADGKVCFPSIQGLPYCRDYPFSWNEDGVTTPTKSVRITRYFIKTV